MPRKRIVKKGRARKRPGTGTAGKYFRVVVRPKSQFSTFRAHDVGRKGHIIRLAGKRKTGTWATQAWLISKKDAVMRAGKLVGKTLDVKKLLGKLRTKPRKVKGNVMKAKPRRNVPERSKPTKAMRAAQRRNIRKAQKARRKRR